MAVPFASVITPDSLIFTAPSGYTYSLVVSDSRFSAAKELVKRIGLELRDSPDDPRVDDVIAKLVDLVNLSSTITKTGGSDVEVRDGVVYYRGEAVYSVLTDRILWGLSEGFDMAPYTEFLNNLKQNPSKRSVDQLYTFVERNKMGITRDGYMLAYKKVRGDFLDIHTASIDNSPGRLVEMPRNLVDDDPAQHCSSGLHCCGQSYLGSYGSRSGDDDRIVIVKVNPKNVVSIPLDHDCAKMRLCEYLVLSEYTGSEKEDLLASKAVFDSRELSVPEGWQQMFSDGERETAGDTDEEGNEFSEDDIVTCVDDRVRGPDGSLHGRSFRVVSTFKDRIAIDEGGLWYWSGFFLPADDKEAAEFLETEDAACLGPVGGPVPSPPPHDQDHAAPDAAMPAPPAKAAVWREAESFADAALAAAVRKVTTIGSYLYEQDPRTGVWRCVQ